MRLLLKDDDPKNKIHNGDPRKWVPGIYRSRVNSNRLILVVHGSISGADQQTAITITSTGGSSPVSCLTDGYDRLPPGEQIKIVA